MNEAIKVDLWSVSIQTWAKKYEPLTLPECFLSALNAVQEHIHQISVFPVNDWSSRARAGHLENISLERRGPFVGWKRRGEREKQAGDWSFGALWTMNGSFWLLTVLSNWNMAGRRRHYWRINGNVLKKKKKKSLDIKAGVFMWKESLLQKEVNHCGWDHF